MPVYMGVSARLLGCVALDYWEVLYFVQDTKLLRTLTKIVEEWVTAKVCVCVCVGVWVGVGVVLSPHLNCSMKTLVFLVHRYVRSLYFSRE